MKSILAAVGLAAILFSGCSRELLGPPPAGVHLRAEKFISYYLDERVGDAVELAVRESFQLWSDATVFRFSYAGKAPGRAARDGRNMVVFMSHWPKELPIGSPAWSQVYLDSSGKIVEADILLNAQAFSFTTRREAAPGSLYVEDVLAKAIGLSLGIGLASDRAGESGDRYRVASAGDNFEPGISPAEMAAYLSLYEAGKPD
jgi:hypothetical protein